MESFSLVPRPLSEKSERGLGTRLENASQHVARRFYYLVNCTERVAASFVHKLLCHHRLRGHCFLKISVIMTLSLGPLPPLLLDLASWQK